MSTLLDEETVTLDGLDFDPRCNCLTKAGRCGIEATHHLSCVKCGSSVGLACMPHSIWARTTDRRGTHVVCGVSGMIRDLVNVVPL